MPRRRINGTMTVLAAIALIWSVIATGATDAAAAAPPGDSSTGAAGPAPVEVTLITGDHVLVGAPQHGRPTVTVLADPATGRVPAYTARYDGEHVYVIPDDVAGLVPGVLDERLFDVTALVRMGYDDASRASIPLIVRNAPGVRTLAAPAQLRVGRSLPSIGGEAAELPKSRSAAFGDALERLGRQHTRLTPKVAGAELGGASHIWLDSKVTATALDRNLTQIKAPAAWGAGLSGQGVQVAVLDTGVDADHPDLTGQVKGTANFTADPVDTDDNGHGTHVASLLAGTGAAAGGARRGVAYNASLYAGKVLDGDAEGQASWVIAGMQWAVAQGADVINMSLGGAANSSGTDDPVVDALQSLSKSSGALFVVAAGNDGSRRSTIQSPGVAPSALTVGAVNPDDSPAFFSSRGPTPGDFRIKPDISAPGVDVVGAKAGARGTDPYTAYSGTSQATPQVAGAAALLLQEHPGWTGQQVKRTLIDTARPAAGASAYDQGGGVLDLARATTSRLAASTATADFGLERWPDRSKHTQQVTLSNPGDSAITVDLSAAAAAVVDGPSPAIRADAEPVTLSTETLTIPAGEDRSFTVTLDPAGASAGTLYSGAVDVTSGGQELLRLPLGFEVEPERYDVAVTVLDRHGNPYAGGEVNVINADDGNGGTSYYGLTLDERGRGTARVAPGWYAVQARVETPAADGTVESVTFTGAPELHVTKDTSVSIDARTATVLRAPTVARVPTRAVQAQIYYTRTDDQHGGFTYFAFPTPEQVAAGAIFVQPTTKPVRHGVFALTTRWRLVPTRDSHQADLYDLVIETPTFPAPAAYRYSAADLRRLARLDVTYHAHGATAEVPEMRASWTDITGIAVGTYQPVRLPTHRVELVTAAPNVHFSQSVLAPGAQQITFFEPDQTYRAGALRTVHWFRTLRPAVVEAPRYPTSQWLTVGLGDGQHVGRLFTGDGASSALKFLRNGTLLASTDQTTNYFDVPDGTARFTATQRLTIDPAQVSAPTSSRTTWTFTSTPPAEPTGPATTPPIVELDYQPVLDRLGYARPDEPLVLGLHVAHLAALGEQQGPGQTPAGPFHRVRLSYSTDHGAHWHALKLSTLPGDRYFALIPADELRPGTTISLHGRAADSQGNAIDQVVQAIIQVRPDAG